MSQEQQAQPLADFAAETTPLDEGQGRGQTDDKPQHSSRSKQVDRVVSGVRDIMHRVGKRARQLRPGSSRCQPKTVLLAPLDSLGHINSLISIANHLHGQGHRTVFLFLEPISNKLREMGHEVYDATSVELVQSVDSNQAQDKWNEVIKATQPKWEAGDPVGNLEFELEIGFGAMMEDIKKYNDNVAKKLDLIRPDLLVIDHYFGIPALFKAKIPFARIFSASPLALHNTDKLPQCWLGLPTNWDHNDPAQKEANDRARVAKRKLYDTYNAYWRSQGMDEDLPTNPVAYIPISPHLNVYMYPEELDYTKEHPLKKWSRCDCMVRNQKAATFEVPEQLRNKPGKLIFLSMGSLASADVILMKRLCSMLADCPHRFIVCKGPLHDQYELPDNMWGEKLVPQLEVLNSIDLIITHGGNNTITESLFYGVQGFIVCPLFGDQFDNATRLHEKGIGIRIDPYNCTKEQLHEAIEKMLASQEAKKKVAAISQRMRKPEARNKALKLLSEFVNKQ